MKNEKREELLKAIQQLVADKANVTVDNVVAKMKHLKLTCSRADASAIVKEHKTGTEKTAIVNDIENLKEFDAEFAEIKALFAKIIEKKLAKKEDLLSSLPTNSDSEIEDLKNTIDNLENELLNSKNIINKYVEAEKSVILSTSQLNNEIALLKKDAEFNNLSNQNLTMQLNAEKQANKELLIKIDALNKEVKDLLMQQIKNEPQQNKKAV